MAESDLVYLKKQLGFSLGEWGKLDDETKEWYRRAARSELITLQLPALPSEPIEAKS